MGPALPPSPPPLPPVAGIPVPPAGLRAHSHARWRLTGHVAASVGNESVTTTSPTRASRIPQRARPGRENQLDLGAPPASRSVPPHRPQGRVHAAIERRAPGGG